ncbi:hypothetical protein COH54_07370 [Neisseria meningitidis]|nr:hypothetical protein COH54_07370 [Neisseria meningitidis]
MDCQQFTVGKYTEVWAIRQILLTIFLFYKIKLLINILKIFNWKYSGLTKIRTRRRSRRQYK